MTARPSCGDRGGGVGCEMSRDFAETRNHESGVRQSLGGRGELGIDREHAASRCWRRLVVVAAIAAILAVDDGHQRRAGAVGHGGSRRHRCCDAASPDPGLVRRRAALFHGSPRGKQSASHVDHAVAGLRLERPGHGSPGLGIAESGRADHARHSLCAALGPRQSVGARVPFLAPFSMPALALALRRPDHHRRLVVCAWRCCWPEARTSRGVAISRWPRCSTSRSSSRWPHPCSGCCSSSNRIRAAALVVLGYLLLTVASALVPAGAHHGPDRCLAGAFRTLTPGVCALSNLAFHLRVPKASTPMALALLLAFGAWVSRSGAATSGR